MHHIVFIYIYSAFVRIFRLFSFIAVISHSTLSMIIKVLIGSCEKHIAKAGLLILIAFVTLIQFR